MKKILSYLFAVLICSISVSDLLSYGEVLEENQLYSLSACLMDADSGRILYEKNGFEIRPNASTTKIMTCIVALEYGNMDDVVTISKYAASMPDVQLNIKEGDEFYLKDLLHSLMLESHNDSAVAIAEHIAGSVEEFALLMNKKAYDIGCYDTYFITPNGLDASDDKSGKIHSTTAADLSKIMAYCIKNDEFINITNTRNYTFTNISGTRSYSVNNKNAFLDMMDGVVSGKTGFTNDAGYCYVAALERDGKTYTIALLGCGWPYNKNYKWKDASKLFNYGVNEYSKKSVTAGDVEMPEILIKNGYLSKGNNGTKLNLDDDIYIKTYVKGNEYEVLAKTDEVIEYEMKVKNVLAAPVDKGEVVGKITYRIGDEDIKEYNIYAGESVKKVNFSWIIKSVKNMFFMK